MKQAAVQAITIQSFISRTPFRSPVISRDSKRPRSSRYHRSITQVLET